MLQIVFSTEDLARVRIAQRPDLLWETVLSLHQLGRSGRDAGPYSHWAGWVRSIGRDRVSASARVLHELAPPRRYFPDFLTPAEVSGGLDAGLEAILHTPRHRLRAEIAKAARGGRMPAWTDDLAAGRPDRLGRVTAAIRGYHAAALEPFYDRIGVLLDSHRAAAMARLAGEGPEALLGNLGGGIRWQRPMLTARYPAGLRIDLQGRGITLVPSFFCRDQPVTLADDALDPVLVYPIDPPPGWMQPKRPATGAERHLAALIGEPRARLLRALTTPAGTGELSARTAMSVSSASEHTAVLRDAGLVETTRRGRSVVHRLTPLGLSLRAGDVRF